MTSSKIMVLLFTDWFEPGYRAGGPIRSCANIAEQLKDEREIFVFTSNMDLGASQPYAGIQSDIWLEWKPGVKVFYASRASMNWSFLRKELGALNPDFVYFNSMFSLYYTIYPLLMIRTGRFKARVILAPRGMLRASALQFKNRKKKFFLSLFKMLGLHKQILFHATDDVEMSDIKKQFGSKANAVKVNDFPGTLQSFEPVRNKSVGQAHIIFIGRIHPVKNLDYLLTLLANVKQSVTLTIVASVEVKSYWQDCEQLIKQLNPNITIDFKGEFPNNELLTMIRQHHLFVLPTKGENFGHAIFESLAAGRPVLISNQTPWRDLAAHNAGWDLPLSQPEKFTQTIEQIAAMDQNELNEWCNGAWNYCRQYIESSGIKEQYLKLFS